MSKACPYWAKRPYDFERVFILRGWRGIETIFGARTTINQRWIAECGGVDALQMRRRAYRAAIKAQA